MTLFICFIYIILILKKEINSALALKYYGYVMMWRPEEDYSVI